MRAGMATDHGGFGLKNDLVEQLRAAGHEVVDFGACAQNPEDDYPDFVIPLAQSVARGRVERGIAICGSGVGVSVCANKVPGVRAALIHDNFSAWQGVEGRSPQHHLRRRPDDRPVGCLGPHQDVPGGRVQSGRAAPAPAWESRFAGTARSWDMSIAPAAETRTNTKLVRAGSCGLGCKRTVEQRMNHERHRTLATGKERISHGNTC